ncbi:MAG: hypothetical protein ACOZAK_02565 [Patescibacteria group bacterium]
MKRFLLIFLNCYLFFAIFPNFIFAQVFNPSSKVFNSDLDGLWEFGTVNVAYRLSVMPAEFSQPISYVVTEINQSDFLVGHGLELNFSVKEEFLFQFSFNCETVETLVGFDQPYLVIFIGEELIALEEDLALCGQLQKRYFLLPAGEKISLYFGQMGDLTAPTTITIEELGLFTRLVQPTKEIASTLVLPSPRPTFSYPSPAVYNWNEPMVTTGQALGVTDDQTTHSSFWLWLSDYFPYLVGLFVFLISLPLLILVSAWFSNLKLRKEKNEQD